jgi:hypothetical protein
MRRNDLSWLGTAGSVMLTLVMVAVVANPVASLAATHTVLAENGSASW